jgi:hypothetical protein
MRTWGKREWKTAMKTARIAAVLSGKAAACESGTFQV